MYQIKFMWFIWHTIYIYIYIHAQRMPTSMPIGLVLWRTFLRSWNHCGCFPQLGLLIWFGMQLLQLNLSNIFGVMIQSHPCSIVPRHWFPKCPLWETLQRLRWSRLSCAAWLGSSGAVTYNCWNKKKINGTGSASIDVLLIGKVLAVTSIV